jgi:hypothetical protein
MDNQDPNVSRDAKRHALKIAENWSGSHFSMGNLKEGKKDFLNRAMTFPGSIEILADIQGH